MASRIFTVEKAAFIGTEYIRPIQDWSQRGSYGGLLGVM